MKLNYIGKTARPRRNCSFHSHECWELIYNTRGSGNLFTQDAQYPFADRSVILIPPGIPHRKVAACTFTDYYLQFTGCNLQERIYCAEDTGDRKLHRLLQLLHSAYHENLSISVQDSIFSAFFGILQPSLTNSNMDIFVQKLQQHIIASFTDPDFSLADAMADIPLNDDHLRRCFKEALGVPPHVYLTQLRLEHAKHLLRTSGPDVTIGEVAYNSGFYDPLYFSRLFRKYIGCSPTKWQ